MSGHQFDPVEYRYGVDGGTLHVDGTNDRVGIGTITPSNLLQVNGTMAIGDGTAFSGDLFMKSSSGSAFIYFEGGPTSAGPIAAQRYLVGQDGSGFMRLSQHKS